MLSIAYSYLIFIWSLCTIVIGVNSLLDMAERRVGK